MRRRDGDGELKGWGEREVDGGGIYRPNAISQAIKLRRRRRNNISRTFLRSPNSLCTLQYYRAPSASSRLLRREREDITVAAERAPPVRCLVS